jgi:hypothetical protein
MKMRYWPALMFAMPILGGCESSCLLIQLPNMGVEVRDSLTGLPAAFGATGSARVSNTVTDLISEDSLSMGGNWGREQAGRYVVVVRKPGYKTATVTENVEQDGCHVKTKILRIRLTANSAALAQTPVLQVFGTTASASRGSAGIQVRGDTLLIIGSTLSRGPLAAVAFRMGENWHIQLQPPANTAGPSMQSFELRYRLPPGRNELLITSALGDPVILYEGSVTAR